MKNKIKQKHRVVIGVVFYNEAEKLPNILERSTKTQLNIPYEFVFVDDGSTDKSSQVVADFIKSRGLKNHHLISLLANRGVGNAIRNVINYGKNNGFTVCVIVAGNGKDNPTQIPKLIDPIVNQDYDYVQGSRYLKGGSYQHLPLYRNVFIRGFTLLFILFTKRKATDSSNGFRAYKLSLFNDPDIDINQTWLDRYELETYLHYKVLVGGYKVKEVAVKKDYLLGVKSYTKMAPLIGWWRMARPLFLLKFRFKK